MDHEDEIRKLIRRRDAERLAERVMALDGPSRRRVAAMLPEVLKELPAVHSGWDSGGLAGFGPVLRVAGAATLGGAAAVASWLYRRSFAPQWAGPDDDVDLILAVLAGRPAAWRADLAERLARRLRAADDRGMRLALELLRQTGIEPPRNDALVAGWAAQPPEGLADDPLLGHLLPRLFEAQGVGRVLQWDTDPDRGLLGALLRLAGSGRVRRADLLDGCLRRFLLGGTPVELRFFVRLHEALDPQPAEVEPRARDYLPLLPAAPGTVAEAAAKRLRGCPALTAGDLAEAWESLLFRPERKLVRAGLSWLRAEVRRAPELAVVAAAPLARAFGAGFAELQEKAAELALACAPGMDEQGRETIRQAIGLLPPEPGARVADAFGGGTVAEAEPVHLPPLPAAPERARPFEPPPAEPGELVELWSDSHLHSWQTWERLLAGFVTLAYHDRDALAAALATIRTPMWKSGPRAANWTSVDRWFQGLADHLTDQAPDAQVWRTAMPVAELPTPQLLVLYRAAEILRALEEGTLPPLLLATPTHDTGHVAADELVRRMEVLEAAGVKPLAADLQQALLRLPPGELPDAGRLTSAAGRILAGWRHPEPELTLRWYSGNRDLEVNVDCCGHDHPVELMTFVRRRVRTGLPLVDLMFRRFEHHVLAHHLDWWPAMLPSHREVAAAHLTRGLLRGTDEWTLYAQYARSLARAEGPVGESFAVVLARLLGDARQRPEAVEVLLEVAARGELPAGELGRQVGLMLKSRKARMGDMVAALGEAAERGAHAQVWSIAVAALPVLLPAPGQRPRNGLAGFVVLAARVAGWCGARGEIPQVRDLASRKGSSALLRELRGLHTLLTSPGGHGSAGAVTDAAKEGRA
ncbi:DUF6493 family protein [Nonomuraea sp. N2-4H]|uniref:DUF7824 domain-containing protein n=1 Tax=Nonomuraea sp. N2-4H TaxID=3128898 RepID=UPI00324F6AEC